MTEQEIIQLLKKSLQEYFSPNGENKRFFDATQIPRVCDNIEKLRQIMEKKTDDHEGRIRTLEKNMWRNAGIASVLGALGMWALNKFF